MILKLTARVRVFGWTQVSTTGLKWLEPIASTFCVLIGTDITLPPFLQAF